MSNPEQYTITASARDCKLPIPLPGLVDNIPTPFTEIPDNREHTSRTASIEDTPPDLPPPRSNSTGKMNPFFKQPKTISLIPFASGYSDRFPLHIKVAQGHYATTSMKTLSGQEELIALYEKKRELVLIKSKSGKTYSVPYGSSIRFSLLHDPHKREADALKGATFKSLDLKNVPIDQLPKVVSCVTKEQSASHEVYIVKEIDSKAHKMRVQSISTRGEPMTEKEFDMKAKHTFSTRPNIVSLYLSDIIKYVHSLCPKEPATPTTALLDFSALSSTDLNLIKSTDPSLMEPVTLVETTAEYSMVVVRVDPSGHYDNCQPFEIPLDDTLPIEITVLDRPEQEDHYTVDPPDYRSLFDPRKLKIWAIDKSEKNQGVQQIFYSNLRPDHEMEGIDVPHKRYQEIEEPKPQPVSIPVLPSPRRPVKTMEEPVAPPLPPKPQPPDTDHPPPVPYSPQGSTGSSHSSTSGPVDTPQHFTQTKEFKELLSSAVKETMRIERILSTGSNTPDSPSAASASNTSPLHEPKQVDKLDPDNLRDVVSELIDCEVLWYFLAIDLGVPKSRLDTISMTHSSDPHFCRRGLIEAISYWLNNSSDACWSAIVKALFKLEKKNKAREIARKYDVDIPTIDESSDSISLELQDDLTSDQKEEIKRLRILMEQKSEEFQDMTSNVTKQKMKLKRLERKLAEVKEKLKFNEEYTLVLTYGSQIVDLKNKERRENEHSTVPYDKEMSAYKRRLNHVQKETTELQKQLLGIEAECREVIVQLHSSQQRKISLSQELQKLEREFNKLFVVSHGARGDESTEQQESTEYYNIVVRNGKVEQKMHQREITQLQEELQMKEHQLQKLQDKLKAVQQNLAEVEHRLSSQYTYVPSDKSLMDSHIQDENMKTSLQADKVDYNLQIANLQLSKTDMESRLEIKENMMQQGLKLYEQAQAKVKPASSVVLSDQSSPASSGHSEVFTSDTDQPLSKKTPSRKKGTTPPTRLPVYSKSLKGPKPTGTGHRRRLKTDDTGSTRLTPNQTPTFRARSGATATRVQRGTKQT